MLQNVKYFVIMLCIIFVSSFTLNVHAQEKPFAVKGITEIAGSLSFSSFTTVSNGKTGDAISIFTFAPQVGYFVTDGFEIGLTTGISLLPGLSIITPEDGESSSLIQLFFSPSYNFLTSNRKLYPFIEADLGYTSLSSGNQSESGFSYGGRLGLKIVAAEHLLITFSGQYLALTFNDERATDRNGLNYLTFGIGVSGYF